MNRNFKLILCGIYETLKPKPTIMNKGNVLIITFFFLFHSHLFGQKFLDRLNALPPSIVVKAPEFDVDKKFIFNIDSLNKVLIIQDIRRNPETKEFNIDQIIYEIPLNDLSVGSFKAVRNPDDKTMINLKIGTVNNKLSIIQYFLRYDEVVAINILDILQLGSWNYSEQFASDFKEIIPKITENLSDKSYSTNFFQPVKSLYKFYTDRVIAIGLRDSLKEFKDGYYYAASLTNPPCYSKNITSSNSRLLKNIKTELKRNDIPIKNRHPVFIRINSNGVIESIYLPDLSLADNQKIAINNIDQLNPGNDSGVKVKSKILLILK